MKIVDLTQEVVAAPGEPDPNATCDLWSHLEADGLEATPPMFVSTRVDIPAERLALMRKFFGFPQA